MDEDIDKTGYTKLKKDAVCKAIKYCSRIKEITIGPDASPAPCTPEQSNLVLSHTFQKRAQKAINNANSSENYLSLISEKDKEEERYCAKKILAELNKFCIIDGQRKKFTLVRKHNEKLEQAKQDVELMVANHEANDLIRRQELKEQENSIQNQLLLKQQQLATSELITRDTTNKRLQEIKKLEEEQLLLKEKAKEITRLCEVLYNNQKEFTDAYSRIVDIVKNCKEIAPLIAADIDQAGEINKKFIAIFGRCKDGEITVEDVSLSSSLLNSIIAITTKIKKEKERAEAELQAKKAQEAELKEKKAQEIEIQEKSLEIRDNKAGDTREVSKSYNYLERYITVTKYLTEVEAKLKPFITDESYKKYRSDCQKIVNLSVNAISPCSAAHVMDKLKKLSALLQGQYVNVADTRVSTSSHPLGLIYCTNLLAEKIVRQGEQVVSSKPDAAFAIAAVTVALWMGFPDFGKLLLAHFYRRCPYLIPAYWDREEDQTEEEYYK